jgi:hypothetical protein
MVKRLEVIPTGNDFLALERGELDVVSTGFAGGSFGAEEGLADAALKPLKNAKFGQVAGPPPSSSGRCTSIRPRPSRTTMSVSARPSPTRSTAMTWSSGILLGRGIVGPSGGLVPSNP